MTSLHEAKEKSSVKVEFMVPQSLLDEVQEIVRRTPYRDCQHFLETSVRNQLTLESTRDAENRVVSQQSVETPFPTYRELGRSWDRSRLNFIPPLNPELLRSPHMPFCNRIFPVKVAARVLCNLLEDQADLRMDFFGETLCMIAEDFGKYLLSLDRAWGHGLRLEALSTGFPGRKRDKLASRHRFLQHFVGFLDSGGKANGMMLSLGFAGITPSNRIGLCESGEEFGKLENPILDNRSASTEPSYDLSVDESKMYMEIIEKRLPPEARAMKSILEILNKGGKSYQEVSNEFTKSFSIDGMVTTNILSPVLGRMRELMLIKVRQDGLKTHYELT